MTTGKVILTVVLTIIGLSFLMWLINWLFMRNGGLHLPCPNPSTQVKSKVSIETVGTETKYYRTIFSNGMSLMSDKKTEITIDEYTAFLKKFPAGEEKIMICNFNLNQQA